MNAYVRKICFFFCCIMITTCQIGFAEGFKKNPYLQNVKTEEITISWKIDEDGDFSDETLYYIEYGTEEAGYTDLVSYPSASADDPKLFHLTLTGLTPGVRYLYKVQSGTVEETGGFFTAVDNDQPFSFAVFSDPQLQDEPIHDWQYDVVNLLNEESQHFVICAGDMWFSNDGPVVEHFFTLTQGLINNTPLFPVLGNHEYWRSNARSDDYTQPSRYKRYFTVPDNLTATEDYYSIDYGNSHFLFVNTNEAEGAPDYREDSEQYDAIAADLENAATDPDIVHIFVIMHKPAHNFGIKHGTRSASGIEEPDISVHLGSLFQKYNVDIVLSGHEHNYQRFEPVDTGHLGMGSPPGEPNEIASGVTYIVTGGLKSSDEIETEDNIADKVGQIEDEGAAGTLPEPPLTLLAASRENHAIFVNVDNHDVQVEVKTTEGKIVDQFTVVRGRPVHTVTPPSDREVSANDLLGPIEITHNNPTDSTVEFTIQGYVTLPSGRTIILPKNKRIRSLLAGKTITHQFYLPIPSEAEIGTTTFGFLVTYIDSGETEDDSFIFDVVESDSTSFEARRIFSFPENIPFDNRYLSVSSSTLQQARKNKKGWNLVRTR